MKPEYNDHVVIGPRIKRRREQLGLTQRDLAEKSGIPQPTLARIETERNEPKLRQIVAIAGALTGGSIDALLSVTP